MEGHGGLSIEDDHDDDDDDDGKEDEKAEEGEEEGKGRRRGRRKRNGRVRWPTSKRRTRRRCASVRKVRRWRR